MDSMTLIAIISIITAGLTISVGVIGPALGEGKAVATALSFAGAATRRLRDHYPDIVRRPGDNRIHSNILFRGFHDSDFRQSILESCYCRGAGK